MSLGETVEEEPSDKPGRSPITSSCQDAPLVPFSGEPPSGPRALNEVMQGAPAVLDMPEGQVRRGAARRPPFTGEGAVKAPRGRPQAPRFGERPVMPRVLRVLRMFAGPGLDLDAQFLRLASGGRAPGEPSP